MSVFRFDDTFARQVPGMVTAQPPVPVADPAFVRVNDALAGRLGLDVDLLADADSLGVFAGNTVPDGADPAAQVYAGHQFGSYNPQLGDGRQVVLGEILAPDGARFDVALKGSGRTPYSRGGDGRASLGPVLREYLMGEAMHALGVPTTRGLAAVTTGEMVRRQQPETGAILTRVAASHLRVGTFQWAAARSDRDQLARLVDYALWRHGPTEDHTDITALVLLRAVVERQATLIATWMHLGFIHGVMNTDNMTISGETIDYGPCAFLETHDPTAAFSSIDHGGRYAYGNQPTIGLWNLARFAESLLAVIDDDTEVAVKLATDVLDDYESIYDSAWLDVARRKLGAPSASRELAVGFERLMADGRVDHHLGWRRLADAAAGNPLPLRGLLGAGDAVDAWWRDWEQVADRSPSSVAEIRATSPIYVPRNHLVDEALNAALGGDLAPFDRLMEVLRDPFTEQPNGSLYAEPAPPAFTAGFVTYCGT